MPAHEQREGREAPRTPPRQLGSEAESCRKPPWPPLPQRPWAQCLGGPLASSSHWWSRLVPVCAKGLLEDEHTGVGALGGVPCAVPQCLCCDLNTSWKQRFVWGHRRAGLVLQGLLQVYKEISKFSRLECGWDGGSPDSHQGRAHKGALNTDSGVSTAEILVSALPLGEADSTLVEEQRFFINFFFNSCFSAISTETEHFVLAGP